MAYQITRAKLLREKKIAMRGRFMDDLWTIHGRFVDVCGRFVVNS